MQSTELNRCENRLTQCRQLLALSRRAREQWEALSSKTQDSITQALDRDDEQALESALRSGGTGSGSRPATLVDGHIARLVREGLAQSDALVTHLKTEPVDPARPAIAAAREFLEAETGHHRDINAILAISTCKAKLAVLGVAADQAYDHGSIIL